jgi:hypothetical protein
MVEDARLIAECAAGKLVHLFMRNGEEHEGFFKKVYCEDKSRVMLSVGPAGKCVHWSCAIADIDKYLEEIEVIKHIKKRKR